MCQSVDKGTNVENKQRAKGTNTFKVIHYTNIPVERCKETYNRVVCELRPQKYDPHRIHITIGGNCIYYPVDVGAPTGSFYIFKLIINIVLSRCDARFASFDINNFYLEIPMDSPEYVLINILNIPQ